MCEDAVKIARESRRKAFVVILMVEEPDTVEMWFGRYVLRLWSLFEIISSIGA